MEDNLLIAAIAASSAIVGSVTSQLVTIMRDWLHRKHQRNTMLRDKYESLANLVTSSQEWLSKLSTARSIRELQDTPPVDARNALILSYIYFPLLRAACEEYMTSCVKFQSVLIDNHEFRNDVDCGTQAVHKNRQSVEYASNQLQKCRQDLDEQIIKHAGIYAKA